MAIDRARQLESEPRPSVYGALREKFPHLHPHLRPKRMLIHMSRAIEDECVARSPHPLLFACFQHERFYRQAQRRWRELARGAECAIVLADFARTRRPSRGPMEVPVAEDDPLMREWVVVCDAPQLPGCMVGWERPSTADERRFETIWTVEPDVVREAARVCCMLAGRTLPELVDDLGERLAEPAGSVDSTHVRAAVELATRMALYATDQDGRR
ncbi:MAG: hypothetical protein JOZ73_12985 [Solirubrobacterales bacterium]|nr:hypothetical protein [Solirubrobacterales bacterium]